MVPEAVVQQADSGWLRLSIPAMRGNAGYFAELESRLAAAPDLLYLESVPSLGCLMVDLAADTDTVLRFAEQNGLFQLTAPDAAAWVNRRLPRPASGQDPTKAPGPKPWLLPAFMPYSRAISSPRP